MDQLSPAEVFVVAVADAHNRTVVVLGLAADTLVVEEVLSAAVEE